MAEMTFLAIALLVGMTIIPCLRAPVVQRCISTAMTEMTFLTIALLVGMTIFPCFRAPVMQRRILSVPHVPLVTTFPLAPRCSTPCMPLSLRPPRCRASNRPHTRQDFNQHH